MLYQNRGAVPASRFAPLPGLMGNDMSTHPTSLGQPLAGAGTAKGLLLAARVSTGLVAAVMAFSGALYLVGPRPVLEVMRELGYPPYFVPLLGVAKLLGVVALVAPWPRGWTLREWAYAGFTFDLVAAIVSHLATGGSRQVAQPLFVLTLLMTSYFLRRHLAEANRAPAAEGRSR